MSHSPGSLVVVIRVHVWLLIYLCSHSEKERKRGRMKEAKKEGSKEGRKAGKRGFMA